MVVYEVWGLPNDWFVAEEEDWRYAVCATKELAEKALKEAIEEDEDHSYLWQIKITTVTEKKGSY